MNTEWAIVIIAAVLLIVVGLMVDDWLQDERMNRKD